MEANYFTGVDVSKHRLDWQVNGAQNQPLLILGKAMNRPSGISKLLEGWSRQDMPLEEMVLCFEHTGPYGLLLAAMLEQAGIRYVMVSPAQVQRSSGIRRGKSDLLDAGRLGRIPLAVSG